MASVSCQFSGHHEHQSRHLFSVKFNLKKFQVLFSFCSWLKCCLSGLEFSKCLSEFRSSLIWVGMFVWQPVFENLECLYRMSVIFLCPFEESRQQILWADWAVLSYTGWLESFPWHTGHFVGFISDLVLKLKLLVSERLMVCSVVDLFTCSLANCWWKIFSAFH